MTNLITNVTIVGKNDVGTLVGYGFDVYIEL